MLLKRIRDLVLIPILLGILLFFLVLALAPRSLLLNLYHLTHQSQSSGPAAPLPIPTGNQATPGSQITGSPTISAALIDSVLCSASSPACHTGQALYDLGKEAGIDPVFALAFFQHESRYGLEGVAVDTRSLGNIRCTDGYPCIDGFRAYASWEESYKDWYQLLLWYIGTLKKKTLRDILYTYAPPIENSTEGYIAAVCSSVNGWRALALGGGL